MSYMEWSEALAVGIDEVDDQHRWLVDATNRLHAALSQEQPDRVVIGETLEGLMDYTMNHFIMEEEMFQRCGYADAAAHKAMHDAFTEKVMRVLSDFEGGGDIGMEVLALLKGWLQGHIMRVDRAYVGHVTPIGH